MAEIYVMPQTTADFQAILDAALLVANEGGALTQTLQEVQTKLDEEGSGVAINLLAASQPIVQSATGSTLPSITPTDYTAGDEIAFGYYALTDITNLIIDGFGNLTLSDPLVDTGSVYFETDIPTNIAITDLYGYAVEGAATNVTTSFTSAEAATGLTLTEVSGKARGVIDLAQAKAFSFSISEQSGGVNIDTTEEIIRGKLILLWEGTATDGTVIDITDGGKWSRSDFTYLHITAESSTLSPDFSNQLYYVDDATEIGNYVYASTNTSSIHIYVNSATETSITAATVGDVSGSIKKIYGVKL